MKKIYKFKLDIVDEQSIIIPQEYEMLSAQQQYGDLVLWVLVNPVVNEDEPIKEVKIHIVGTGEETSDDFEYISTVQMLNGLVWHVFEG